MPQPRRAWRALSVPRPKVIRSSWPVAVSPSWPTAWSARADAHPDQLPSGVQSGLLSDECAIPAQGQAPPEPRVCDECGATFAGQKNALTCSAPCRQRNYRRRTVTQFNCFSGASASSVAAPTISDTASIGG